MCAALCVAPTLAAPLAASAEELSDTGVFLDGVAAIVNDGIVLKSRYYETLDAIRSQAAANNFQLPPEEILREQVLERVILVELQLQRADMIGLDVTDSMLNQLLEDVARRMNPDATLADLPELLAADGVSYQVFRRQMREDFTLEQLRRIVVEREIVVTDRELNQCLADIEDNVVVNSEYELSHILLSLPENASSAEVEAIVEIAQSIYERASDGADFRALAVEFSQSPTALQGGSLGWMQGEQVPTIFTEILAPLTAGDVSEPFRTASSIHIVKVNDMRGATQKSEEDQVLARHILVMPNEIIDDSTAEQRLWDAYNRIQEGEEFAELARLLSDDPGSAGQGGELGWAGPGTFVPEFEQIANSLEIGVLSEPFKSQFGWHILEVMDRRIYDNTEELKEQNCVIRIRAGKREDETQLWLRRLRDEAYVDVRM
ncbi:MAG: peptidylprolyl isomerase [Woeseiaceae bacterium]|nr:peptidylprolyl isomerase [Woeseiaceae bacterium]